MSEGPASGFHPQTKHCSLLDHLLPFGLFRLFSLMFGLGTRHRSYRMLKGHCCWRLGLIPRPDLLQSVEYLVEGPESGTRADSRSGYSHCG